MNRTRILACTVLITIVQGCAFSKATLDVGLTEEASLRGPLSSIDPVSVQIGEVEDARIDKERIGWKKNGYGANTADIVSAQPVEEVIRQALSEALVANGHELGGDGLRIESTLKNFWFETDINFWTVELIGNMEVIFALFTGQGAQLYSNTYSGSYSEKRGAAGEKTWAMVMSKSLEALLEDFAFDEDLVEAIESYDAGVDTVGADTVDANTIDAGTIP